MGAVFASFPSTLCQIHIVYVIKRDKQSEEPSLWRRLLCPPNPNPKINTDVVCTTSATVGCSYYCDAMATST